MHSTENKNYLLISFIRNDTYETIFSPPFHRLNKFSVYEIIIFVTIMFPKVLSIFEPPFFLLFFHLPLVFGAAKKRSWVYFFSPFGFTRFAWVTNCFFSS